MRFSSPPLCKRPSTDLTGQIAFETYYGVTPDSLGRRIEPSSWRSEYIARVSLLRCVCLHSLKRTRADERTRRQWHRARTPTVIHNPSLGALSQVHINLPSASSSVPGTSTPSASPRTADSPSLAATTLLSLSLDMGAAVHSSPFTGKVSKRPLFASPVDHLGRPLGLPIVAATAVGVSIDGTKVVWGMRDGSLRFVNSSPTGGRGTAGGAIEAGEVRCLQDAHREGSSVQAVAFSSSGGTGGGRMMRGLKQRTDVFVTAGADGVVAVWSLTIPVSVAGAAGVRDRPPVAIKVWQVRWDVALDAAPVAASGTAAEAAPRRRIKATSIAFDSGWVGRYHGRPASVAVGRSDGKTVVWPAVYIDEESPTSASDADARVLQAGPGGMVDYLVFDPPSTPSSPLSLLAHQAGSPTFSRFVFSTTADLPIRTTFGHPQPDHLSALTAFAVDFDEAATSTASLPSTPAEGKLSFHPRPRLFTPSASSSNLAFPALSRSTSTSSIVPLSAGTNLAPSGSFGQRKYVAAGDKDGRVFLWNWEAKQSEEERERGDVVAPSAQIQGLEIDGGGSASRVTALELTDVGIFVGGCVASSPRVGSEINLVRAQPRWHSSILLDPRHGPLAATARSLLPRPNRPSTSLPHARARPDRRRRGRALARLSCPSQPRGGHCRNWRAHLGLADEQRRQEEGRQGGWREIDGAAGAVQRRVCRSSLQT